jgi:biopolymer transport protein ExbD
MASLSTDRAEPNLTPILDMVFQLITFFMLVINFKSASLDLSLKLPVLGSARPVDTGGEEDALVLNIDAEGRLRVAGVIKEDIEGYIGQEAAVSRAYARIHGKQSSGADENELSTIAVVRADRGTPFQLLNRVIATCQKNGFRRFSLKAMNRVEAH